MPKRRRSRDWGKAVPWVALAIALYGAVVSTLQWHDSQAEKARLLDVRLFFGAPIAKGVQRPMGLQVKASNPGYQPVVVTTAGVFFPDGDRFSVDRAKGGWEFPRSIAPGENTTVLLAGQSLEALCKSLLALGYRGTVTLVGFYEDALNTVHRSDPFDFRIEDALKLARSNVTPTGSEDPIGTHRSQ